MFDDDAGSSSPDPQFLWARKTSCVQLSEVLCGASSCLQPVHTNRAEGDKSMCMVISRVLLLRADKKHLS